MRTIITAAALCLAVTAAPAAPAEPRFVMRAPTTGVISGPAGAAPSPPVETPTCEAVFASPETILLPGFVAASWDFAASYLGCWLPPVEARVTMQGHGGGLYTADYPLRPPHPIDACGLSGELGGRIRAMLSGTMLTLISEPTSGAVPGMYGVSVSCILEHHSEGPGLVMTIPLELVIP